MAVEVADYMSLAADGNDGQDGSGCAAKEAGDGAESAPLSAGERRRCAGGLQARLDGADSLVQSWVRWIAGEVADTAQAGGINTAATCSGRNHSGVEGSAGQGGRLALGLPHRVLLIGGDGQGDSAGASWKGAALGGRHRALGPARMLSSTHSQAEEEAGEGGPPSPSPLSHVFCFLWLLLSSVSKPHLAHLNGSVHAQATCLP
eukprot:SAG25_NODE_233_length_11359_cov_14.674600_3_plen_204_part_00